MENTIKVSIDERNKSYWKLTESYYDYEFKSVEQEQEFFSHIKSLINEPDIDFEEKVFIIGTLGMSVKLNKFGFCASQ